MIEIGTYETVDGKQAQVVNSKKIGKSTIFIGRVEGVNHYVNWNEEGKTMNGNWDLKLEANS